MPVQICMDTSGGFAFVWHSYTRTVMKIGTGQNHTIGGAVYCESAVFNPAEETKAGSGAAEDGAVEEQKGETGQEEEKSEDAPELPREEGAILVKVSEWSTVAFPSAKTSAGCVQYEVKLKTLGRYIQMGWATELFTPIDAYSNTGTGDDQNSWAADGTRGHAWHNGRYDSMFDNVSWGNGDVIGVAANLDAGTVSFGKNGEWIEVFSDIGNIPREVGLFPSITGADFEYEVHTHTHAGAGRRARAHTRTHTQHPRTHTRVWCICDPWNHTLRRPTFRLIWGVCLLSSRCRTQTPCTIPLGT